MKTTWLMRMVALALVLAAGSVGYGDYIFDGTDASLITGEDGTGTMYAPPGSSPRQVSDDMADAEWLVAVGSEVVVGGKTYLAMGAGGEEWGTMSLIGIQGNTGTWGKNAVELTSSRETLSLVVYNNGAESQVFNVTVNNFIVPGADSEGAPHSPHWLAADVAWAFDAGVLATQTTVSLAPGESATLSWELFEDASYATYPALGHGDGDQTPRTAAPVVGDWMNQLGIRVDSENALITDVQLSGEEIPEPATMLLVGTGALGLLGYARRKRMV